MTLAKRSLVIILTLLLLCGLFPFGVSAVSDEIETDTGQEEIEEESPTNAESYTLDLAELVEETSSENGAEEEPNPYETGGIIQLDETTTIEYEEEGEDTRAEVLAEIMTEAAGEAMQLVDEEEMLAPDTELLTSADEAVLCIRFKDPASAVSIQTDDGTTQTANLYYMSDNDGQLFSLAPDDLAVEVPVETDEDGCAMIPMQIGTSVHLSVIGGYGHAIASVTLTTASGGEVSGSDSFSYDFVISEDMALEIETEEVGVSIPTDENAVEGIQVMETNGEFTNDPTVTLPAETPDIGHAVMLRSISSNYWGTIEARYEGGGTHPYPNGRSTGVFTVWYLLYDSTTKISKDEDGLGLTMTYEDSGDNYIYTLTDKDAYTTKVFNHGYLTSITDSNGNALYFVYGNHEYSTSDSSWKPTDSNHQLTKIIELSDHANAGTITVATFAYNSDGYLTSITDYANRVTTYTYTSSGKLSTITYPDGKTSSYSYGDVGYLIKVTDNE